MNETSHKFYSTSSKVGRALVGTETTVSTYKKNETMKSAL